MSHCDDCAPEFLECWSDGAKCRKAPRSLAQVPGSDPTIAAIAKCANGILVSALRSLPGNVDDWTTDDKLIAQNLVCQFLDQN